MAARHGVKSIGMIELTAEEELMATKRAHNDPIRLAYELSKEALREVDGRAMSTGNGTADRAWNGMHPKIRTLVVSAYGQLHSPEEQDLTSFLASQQTSIG